VIKKVKNKYEYVKNKFVAKYPQKVCPTKQTVLNNVNNFIKYGSVGNRQKNTPHKKL
jgi:hypothetical protein